MKTTSVIPLILSACLTVACNTTQHQRPPSAELWGIVLTPIDLQAGSTDDKIVVWHNRFLEKTFTTKELCEAAAAKLQPAYNMKAICHSPHPAEPIIVEIDLID